jgi:hypothetical protein
MTAQLPTRITIELHPGAGATGWTARTAVHDGIATALPPRAAEPREEQPDPAVYEPAPCTCLDDGGCAADHAND